MALSYEFFNHSIDQLSYDATMADDVRRFVEFYNQKSGLDFVYIEQATDRFMFYRVSEYNEIIPLFVTNDHNWFAAHVKYHCQL